MRKSLLTLVFMIALVSASPALAANTRVSGEQIPDLANVCTEASLGTYTMEGGLVGCWYTDDRCYCADPSDDGLCYCVPDCHCCQVEHEEEGSR